MLIGKTFFHNISKWNEIEGFIHRLVDLIETSSSIEQETSTESGNSVLNNLLASTDETKMDLHIKRLLKKYRERKRDENERKKMVSQQRPSL